MKVIAYKTKRLASRAFLCCAFVLAFCYSIFAQDKQIISGTVKDSQGVELPGVNILVKGLKKGTQTDFSGKFLIAAEPSETLVFSYLGMETQEVLVSANTKNLSIVMKDNVQKIDEVVLTGYQTLKAHEFTGAVGKVKMDNIKIGGGGTVDKMLQGQLAGVQVNLTSSVFGTAPRIRIRGSSSITGINEPLWVLDGVVLQQPLNIDPSALYSGAARNLLSSVLGGVNPDDIEDITVLKDASATAIYGTRAVNGVIVITTKRAKRNQPLSISYNSLFTLSMKPTIDNFNVLNSEEETNIHEQLYKIYQVKLLSFTRGAGAYSKLINQLNRRDISESEFYQGLQRIKSVNTDWFGVLFKNAVSQQHSISLSYGTEKVSGRLSLSYFKDPGYSLGQDVDRYTLNFSNKYDLSDKISVEGLVKYANVSQINPGETINPFEYAATTSRAMSAYAPDGSPEYYTKNRVPFNVIEELSNNYIGTKSHNINLQVQFDYKPIEKLKFTLLANRTTIISSLNANTTENSFEARSTRGADPDNTIFTTGTVYEDPDLPIGAVPNPILPFGGFMRNTNVNTAINTFRFQGDYTILDKDEHRLNVFAGTEVVSMTSSENFFTGIGYIFGSGTAVPTAEILKMRTRNGDIYYSTNAFNSNRLSFYANLNYTFLNRYSVALSARNDATNVLGTSTRNRFLPIYNVSGAWIVTDEPFMKNQRVFTELKLRGSFGLRGNAGNRGPDLKAYYKNRTRPYPSYNELVIDVEEPEISDLDWEKEYITNLGLDVGLFGKVRITTEFYNRNNFDLIGSRPVPTSSGVRTKTINWAIMQNRGLELSIENTNPWHITSDLTFKANFNIGFNKNTILSNYIGNQPTATTVSDVNGYPFQGKPLTGLYSYKFAGLDADGLAQYYDSAGNKVYAFPVDIKDYGILEYQGSRDPIYSGGVSPSFEYKGFVLSALFVYQGGNVVRKSEFYRQDSTDSLYNDDMNIPGDFENRWRLPGNEQYTNIPRLMDDRDREFYTEKGFFVEWDYTNRYNRSNIRTVDASFIRIRNVSLRYNLAKKLTDKLRLKYANVEVQATNLAVFASQRLAGQDPEILTQGTNIPPIKSFTLGINVGF